MHEHTLHTLPTPQLVQTVHEARARSSPHGAGDRRKDGGEETAKEVDFDKILEALAWTDGACIQDVVAMDLLEALWEL